MTAWLTSGVALFLLALAFVHAVTDVSDDPEIDRLVKHLGNSDFRIRDAARKRLEEIGEPALGALHKATTSNDVEARRRAEQLVAIIERKWCLTGHTHFVWSVCVSADGKRVLTSSADATLRLWDADTGQCLRVFKGHTDRNIGAILSPDGQHVLSGSHDGRVTLRDANTGKFLSQMAGHTQGVNNVVFGPEGKALSSSADETLRLWDLNTAKCVRVIGGHTRRHWMVSVAYNCKAKLAATYGNDRSICLLDLDTGKEVRKLTGKMGHTSVCFSPDGERLLSSGQGGTYYIWDVQTGKELKQIQVPMGYCAAFSPDGKRFVSGGDDTIVRVWDAASGKELRKYDGHTGRVTSVTFFPDGKRIASASQDHSARVWRAPR